MIKLRLAEARDFPGLRKLRIDVFRAELGIQDETYQDVFNDYYSKNLVLEKDGEAIGAVRLAFSRELQEYFVSYLVMRPAFRKLSLVRLLLGGVVALMRRNRIERVRLHASDENLGMYLAIGCRVAGPRFRKYGFNCVWTPLIYELGTNADSERSIGRKVATFFPRLADLDWRFSADIALCPNPATYRSQCASMMNEAIGSKIPHLGTRPPVFRTSWVEPLVAAAIDSPGCPAPQSANSVDHLNGCFNRRDPIIVRRDAEAFDIARTYSLLTGKHFIPIRSWKDVRPEDFASADSVLLVLDLKDVHEANDVVDGVTRQVPAGIALASDPAALSSLMLKNYFEFIGPSMQSANSGRMHHPRARPFIEVPVIRLLATDGRTSREIVAKFEPRIAETRGHCILAYERIPQHALQMLDSLLVSGFAIGAAVRFANLAYSEGSLAPFRLIGDPSLRVFPCVPRTLELDAHRGGRGDYRQILAFGTPTRLFHAAGLSDTQLNEDIAWLQSPMRPQGLRIVSFLDGNGWQTFAHPEQLQPVALRLESVASDREP